jgi:hypothetical protein
MFLVYYVSILHAEFITVSLWTNLQTKQRRKSTANCAVATPRYFRAICAALICESAERVTGHEPLLPRARVSIQVVCHCPLNAETRSQSQVIPCGIRGGQSGTGTGFSPVLRFSRQNHCISTSHPLIYHRRCAVLTIKKSLHEACLEVLHSATKDMIYNGLLTVYDNHNSEKCFS